MSKISPHVSKPIWFGNQSSFHRSSPAGKLMLTILQPEFSYTKNKTFIVHFCTICVRIIEQGENMRKILLVLALFFFTAQTQAKEMKAPQLFVYIDRACAPLTYADNTLPTVIECLRHELTNPLNYPTGWSKYVNADIQLKLIGTAIEKYPIKTTTSQSESVAKKIAIPIIDQIYELILEEIYKEPDAATTVIPASKLKELRY